MRRNGAMLSPSRHGRYPHVDGVKIMCNKYNENMYWTSQGTRDYEYNAQVYKIKDVVVTMFQGMRLCFFGGSSGEAHRAMTTSALLMILVGVVSYERKS
jgi:hypothetical protein